MCQGLISSSFLLTTDSFLGGIYQIDVATGAVHAVPVSQLQEHPLAIAYDSINSVVYWSDSQQNVIKSITLAEPFNQSFITLPGR